MAGELVDYPSPAATALAAPDRQLYGLCLQHIARSMDAAQLMRQSAKLVAWLPKRVLADIYLQVCHEQNV